MKSAAIDVGTKRTGLAITDPSQKIVSKVKTVDTVKIFEQLEENQPFAEIIIGLPVNLKNNFTLSTYMAVDKAIEIAKYFSETPVYLMDERFTTKIASTMQKKEIIDGISASILLEERLRGANGTRVFWSLPKISNVIVNFISSFGLFKNVMIIGDALRGIERCGLFDHAEIFENNPVFFRLREGCLNCTLNFDVVWDIILQKSNEIDTVICKADHLERIRDIFNDGTFIIVENEDVKDSLLIGGRWLKIEKINKN